MRSLVHRSDPDDSELARRVSSGDDAAFATLDARHRGALQRYAGTLLRRSEHDAEDVVQDVLIRAHQALRAGDGPDELRPWLFRLTRNRAIDEVRRKRWGDESLDSDHAFSGDGREDPETVLRRRETVRRLVEDLADLPVNQRTALLARELDEQSPEQVAAHLGVSVMAAHKLTSRARENLIKTRDARDAACLDIRGTLLDAHERGARPSEHAVRHVKACVGCRAYQRDMRLLTKRLHALNPTFGLPILAGIVKLVGGGGTKTAAGAAAAIALAATGGIVVLDSGVHSPGDPAPFQLLTVRDSQGRRVSRGTPIPEGWTIVTARIRLPAGPSTIPTNRHEPYPGLTLTCPKDMRYAGLQFPNRELPTAIRINPAHNAVVGYSNSVRFRIAHLGLTQPEAFSFGINCQRLNSYGYIGFVTDKFKRALTLGERRLGHVCPRSGGASVRDARGEIRGRFLQPATPVAIQRRSSSGALTRVVSATGDRGWIETRKVCS